MIRHCKEISARCGPKVARRHYQPLHSTPPAARIGNRRPAYASALERYPKWNPVLVANSWAAHKALTERKSFDAFGNPVTKRLAKDSALCCPEEHHSLECLRGKRILVAYLETDTRDPTVLADQIYYAGGADVWCARLCHE